MMEPEALECSQPEHRGRGLCPSWASWTPVLAAVCELLGGGLECNDSQDPPQTHIQESWSLTSTEKGRPDLFSPKCELARPFAHT